MDFAEFIDNQFPIVIYRVNPIEPTLAQYESYITGQVTYMKSLLEKKQKAVVIFDYTHLKFLTSDMRIKRGQFVKDNDVLLQKTIHHIVIMAPSIVARMMIQGVFLVKKPTVPSSVVATMAEAMAMASEQCKKMQSGK
jgi:hypothetical protein